MPDSVALGIRNAGDVGTTDAAFRKVLGALYPNPGIVRGCAVTGRSNLAYNVAEGVAVCSRGSSDGSSLAWVPAGTTPAVAANSASNPRLDAIWVQAHDATQGDADNLVTLGVTQGTAAATPTVPVIPTGATLLAVMQMPAGATKTSSASAYARGSGVVPYGSSLGILFEARDTVNNTPLPTSEYAYAAGTFTLPTARIVDVKQTFTIRCVDIDKASAYCRVLIDNQQVWQGEVYVFPSFATSQYFEFTKELAAGTHSIKALIRPGVNGSYVRRHYGSGWAGQYCQVVDAGAVS